MERLVDGGWESGVDFDIEGASLDGFGGVGVPGVEGVGEGGEGSSGVAHVGIGAAGGGGSGVDESIVWIADFEREGAGDT